METQRLYLDGSPYSATVVAEKTGGASAQLYFLHRDYLGSITQVSDKFGNLAAEYSYDAWGRMRNVSNWTVYTAGVEPELRFGRGYTGHEHLNRFGLINMNARLYDPVLGRFLAPDPLVASPDESNGYNRYMYAANNPLMYVDIDGEDGYPGGYNGGYPGGYGPYTPNYNYPGTQSPGFNFGGGFNYNGGYSGGGYGEFGGGYSYGSPIDGGFVFGLLNWAFGPHHPPSYYRGLVISVPSQYSTYKPKTVLKNVSGSGTSTVYAGGSGSIKGQSGWKKGVEFFRHIGSIGIEGGPEISLGNLIYGGLNGIINLATNVLPNGSINIDGSYPFDNDRRDNILFGWMIVLPNPLSLVGSSSTCKVVSAPEGWISKPSKKGGGIVFKDPGNPHNLIRQMPGNPNSPNILQQYPYVKFMKEGKFYDANGKVLPNGNVPGAHIPLNQFNILNMPKF